MTGGTTVELLITLMKPRGGIHGSQLPILAVSGATRWYSLIVSFDSVRRWFRGDLECDPSVLRSLMSGAVFVSVPCTAINSAINPAINSEFNLTFSSVFRRPRFSDPHDL